MKLATLLLFLIFGSIGYAGEQAPQSFTLDGRLFEDAEGTRVLKDTGIIKIQILDSTKTCVLYEERQTFDTRNTNGDFNLQVGESVTSSLKRTANDPGSMLASIFANTSGSLPGFLVTNSQSCAVATPPGALRYVRITVVPDSDGTARTMALLPLDSVPSALTAERAETLGGLTATQFLHVNSAAPAVLSQSNLETVFSTVNYPLLMDLLSGTSASYVKSAANGSLPLPSFASTPSSPTAGQIWYDSSGVLKFWNGTSAQTLGVAGSGITSLTVGAGLTPTGTITTSGSIAVDVGTSAGQIVQVQTGGKLPVLDGSNLTNVTASAFSSTGSISTSGSIAANSANFRSLTLTNAGSQSVTLQPAATITGSPLTFTWPSSYPGVAGYVLSSDTSGNMSWVAQSPGGLAAVSNTASLSNGKVWIGDGTGKAQENTLSGDVTITNTGVSTVGKIQTTAVSASTPTGAGQVLKYNGTTQYAPSYINGADIRSSQAGNASFFPGTACTASQTMTYQSATDTMVCTGISIATSQLTGTVDLTTQASGVLPIANGGTGSATQNFVDLTTAQAVSGVKTYSSNAIFNGSVGIGTATPATALHISGTTYAPLRVDSSDPSSAGIDMVNTSTGGKSIGLYSTGSGNATGAGHTGFYDNTADRSLFDIDTSNGKLTVPAGAVFGWGNDPNYSGFGADTGLARNAAGVLEINNGTPGTRADLRVRTLNPGGEYVGVGTTNPIANLDVMDGTAWPMIAVRTANTAQWSAPQIALSNKAAASANQDVVLFLENQVAGGGADSAFIMRHKNYNGASTFYDFFRYGANGTSSYLHLDAPNQVWLETASQPRIAIDSTGKVGIGTTGPTASLHLPAGVAAAGGAPLKLTAGTNLTTPEPGAIEFDGSSLFYTDNSSVRHTLAAAGAGITALTGDVTASGSGSVAATVAQVGGVTAANVASGANAANAATDVNTASTIVSRDASGNFAAGAITMGSGVLKGSTSGTLTQTVPATVTTYTITWPSAAPSSSGYVLSSDTSGNLSWVAQTAPGLSAVSNTASLANGKIWIGDGAGKAQENTLSGDLSMTNAGVSTVGKVNGVTYGASPSTNTVPVVTGANSVTYETVPVAAGGTGVTSLPGTFVLNGGQNGTVVAGAQDANSFILDTNNTPRITILPGGNVGIGTQVPAALLHLNAGVATAGGAPLKLTAGTNLTTPEPGAIEFDGSSLFYTDNSSVRHALAAAGAGLTALTGDVTASGSGSVAATVAQVGGVTAANVASGANAANAATSANTASTIVARDASGNFAAGNATFNSEILKGSTSGTLTLTVPASVTSYTLKWPSAVTGTSGYVLSSDTAGNLSWINPTTGSLTAVSNQASLANGKVWIGDGSGKAQENALSGDVTITNAGVATVGAIQGKTVTAAPTLAGQVLRYDGTNFVPNFISMADLRSNVTGTTALASACASNQTLTYNSVGDNLACANISLPVAQITGVLPIANGGTGSATQNFVDLTTAQTVAGVKTWSNNAIFNGNVGIGTPNPSAKLQVAGAGWLDSLAISTGATINKHFQVTDSSGNALLTVLSAYSGAVTRYYSPTNANLRLDLGVDGANRGVMNALNDATGNGLPIRLSGGTVEFDTASSGDPQGNPRLFIDGSGNVGIGTAGPGTRLEVASGAANASGLKFDNFNSSTPTGTGQAVGVDASGNLVTVAGGGANPAGSATEVQFRSNATTFGANSLFVWDNTNSRLGIGTATPSSSLTVNGVIETQTGGIKFPDGTVQTTSAYSGTNNTMVSGWPDAIICTLTNPNYGVTILHGTLMPYAGNGLYYYRDATTGTIISVVFNADGSFNSYQNITTSNCNATMSANTLAGRTFNFAKGPAAQWLAGSGSSAYYNAGNVGIGTASPAAKFEIASGTANTSGLKFDNFNSSTPTGTGQAIGVDASGNLITVPASTANPAGSSTEIQFRSNATTFGANALFVWDNTNSRLGIGTATPGSPLTVNGVIETKTGGIKFPDGTVQTTSAIGGTNNSMISGWPDAIKCNITNPGWGVDILYPELMPYSADGNYYYKSRSGYWLEFNSSGTFVGYQGFTTTADCNTSIAALYAAGKAFNFAKGPAGQWLAGSGSSAYYNAGNVGVGTANPAAKFEIASGTANTSGLKFDNFSSSTPTGTGQAVGVDASGNLITIPASTASPAGSATEIQFRSNATTFGANSLFVWDNTNSRLGIGTATPSSPLTVAGLIETTSGGIKFPDGTTQTTAGVGGLPACSSGDSLTNSGGYWYCSSNAPTNTKLLLHGDGTNGSTTFTDSAASPHTMNVQAGATISTAQSKFGGASMQFNGSTGGINTADSPDFEFGGGDFTVDFWFMPANTTAGLRMLVAKYDYGLYPPWSIYQNGTNIILYASSANTSFDIASARTLATGIAASTWYHFALVRSGSSWTSYLNGTQTDTFTNGSTLADNGMAVRIGDDNTNAYPFNGWMDEVRLTKGYARWTGNFTPPTSAYTLTGVTGTGSVNPWGINGSSVFYSGGNVGVGTSTPAVALDVNGQIRPGSSGILTGGACSNEGAMAYDLTNHSPVFCSNSGLWTSMNVGGLGVGQTWQNMTASRVNNTTYTNSTGKPIDVSVSCAISGGSGTTSTFTVNGTVIQTTALQGAVNNAAAVGKVVPAGATYSANCQQGVTTWFELR